MIGRPAAAAASRQRRWKAEALSYGLKVSNGRVFALRCIRCYPRACIYPLFYELVFFFTDFIARVQLTQRMNMPPKVVLALVRNFSCSSSYNCSFS